MKNLMQYFAHPCRSIVFADDRLMSVHITEALRAAGVLVFSTADTPANLAKGLYMMSPARSVALVVTLPRLTVGWNDPRTSQVIVVSRKWAKKDVETMLLYQARRRAPNARNAVHFEREADLYDDTERKPPFRFEELDPELQDLVYGYSFGLDKVDAHERYTGKHLALAAPYGITETMTTLAETSKKVDDIYKEFGKSVAAAHERFAEATALQPRTKSA